MRGPRVTCPLVEACTRHMARGVYIGKADDDTYLHLTGILHHLFAAESAVRNATSIINPSIYYGAFEAYSFDERNRKLLHFRQDSPGKCEMHAARYDGQDTLERGPFPFARGPFYFVSARLVQTLLQSEWFQSDLNQTLSTLASVDDAKRRKNKNNLRDAMVWEDVYTGYALSKVATGPGLALVENGFGNGAASPTYSDGWGMQLAPSTLVWHQRTKKRTAYPPAFAHHWKEEQPSANHHCEPPASTWVRCGWNTRRASTTSCNGARWLRCTSRREAYVAANCSTNLFELKRVAAKWHEEGARKVEDPWELVRSPLGPD